MRLILRNALSVSFLLAFAACQSEYRSSDDGTRMSAMTQPSDGSRDSRHGGSEAVRNAPLTRTALAYPTGERSSSVLLLERIIPSEIQINAPFEYELIVTNLRDLTLRNIVVSDELSDNFALDHAAPPPQSAQKQLTWSIGDLGPRQSKTIRVAGKAISTTAFTSSTSVAYDPLLTCSAPVTQPVLAIAMAAPATALLCDNVPLKITVSNVGTGTARDVNVNAMLPADLTVSSGMTAGRVDALPAGQSRDLVLQAKAARTGDYNVSAMAKAAGDLSAKTAPTTIAVRQPILAIETSGPPKEAIGRTLVWQMTVKNIGDAPARETVLEYSVPPETAFSSATNGGQISGSRVRWSLGTIEPGAARTVSLSLEARNAGVATAAAIAQAYCAAPASSKVETTIVGIPAMMLEVTDDPDPIAYGSEVNYTIEVTNQGSAPGTNIHVVCRVPDGEEFVSMRGPTTGELTDGTITFATLPTLAPKAKAVWIVTARAVKIGDVRFKVALTSDQLYTPVEENESTTLFE